MNIPPVTNIKTGASVLVILTKLISADRYGCVVKVFACNDVNQGSITRRGLTFSNCLQPELHIIGAAEMVGW